MEVKWEANTEHEICSAFIFERARWKRKNREKQLKRTIARLQQQVNRLKRRRHQALLIIDRERAVKNYALMMSGFYDKMDKMEGDIFLTQTYGHDIEGS